MTLKVKLELEKRGVPFSELEYWALFCIPGSGDVYLKTTGVHKGFGFVNDNKTHNDYNAVCLSPENRCFRYFPPAAEVTELEGELKAKPKK